MKSLTLLGLAGLAANVQAHPGGHGESSIAKRGVDVSKYMLPDVSSYSSSQDTKGNKVAMAINSRSTYVETATDFVKKTLPGVEFRLVDDHYTGSSGISHVNFKQTVHGIDVDNADFKVNVGRDGKIFSFGNNFFPGKVPTENPLGKRDFSDPVAALKGAINVLSLPIKAAEAAAEHKDAHRYTLTKTTGAVSAPEARLVYLSKGDGNLALTWRVETDINKNWLLTYVDAKESSKVHAVVDYVNDLATLQVLPWDLNDPSEGDRSVVTDPWNIKTSPFTWFGDGTSNYTVTRGNNAIAQNNPSGGNTYLNNHRPDGGASRTFEFPWSTSDEPTDVVDAAITQLFYTGNKYHDLLYTLGFTEPAGNFQQNNNGKGGRGNDFVILNAQDGSGTDNANFATPPDGQPGRMRMYLFTQDTPNKDACFDAGVVLHEYTHGLSNRLTGGPANSNCLNTLEAGGMGEGWSDAMAVAVHTHKKDNHDTVNNFGHWIVSQDKGIRQYPYATSKDINPMTYATTNSQNEVHAIGTVWATALYQVMWNLIDKHGNTDADFPTFDAKGVPTDGRYLFMKLVVDGMALQPCSPNMIQARDAIIDADKNLTGGSNKCDLWQGFAKRGLGVKAAYGASKNRKEDFSVPTGC